MLGDISTGIVLTHWHLG